MTSRNAWRVLSLPSLFLAAICCFSQVSRPTNQASWRRKILNIPVGTPMAEYMKLIKPMGCYMGRGSGPRDGFQSNVDCKDGTRFDTRWNGDKLKSSRLVWIGKNGTPAGVRSGLQNR